MSGKHQLKHRFHLLKGDCRLNLIRKLSAVPVIVMIAAIALPLAGQQAKPAKASVAEIIEAPEFQLPLTKGKSNAPFGPIQHSVKKKFTITPALILPPRLARQYVPRPMER